MGIATSGLIRAEGNAVTSVLTGDKFVIQRLGTGTGQAYYSPLEATVDEVATFVSGGTLRVRALGHATLSGGTIAVTMASITAAALVFVTEQGTGALAVSVAVTASTGFTLTSSSNADTAIVNYIVYDV